ncbi:transglycosylase domain-containing protein [Tabrizicola oligotrophica]|uniref:peptidoglycan glycosyltransferase n=1 Tax=Tabrizicola oligotrophica TaxID=2710650 RepID=A0A6M0QS71_9RHOB|nr:PBP1A family penicillin-binding protein [Tabrizicola oligotrophica]NEY90276.1 PBP1A family penicillin-binding protein [Tabrizicola oligotrophica]
MAGTGKGQRPMVADRRYGVPKSTRKPASAPPPPRKPRKAAKRQGGLISRFFGFLWRLTFGIFWRVMAVTGLIFAGVVFFFYAQLPPVTDLLDGRARGSVTLLDRNDRVFAWRGETFGGQITADNVSPHLLNAVVATEDKRFYQHFGVSPRGIASAIRINLSEGRGPLEGNGGSTITQQVAKLLCLGVVYDQSKWKSEADYEEDCRSGGVYRKLKELPFAVAMEVKYSKEEILTIYFNRAYLGAGARGFEAAAQRYFGISANEVNPAQAAMLAGLLKAPSRYAPTNDLQRAQDRANIIIGLMEEQGYLTKDEADAARARPAQLSQAAQTKSGGFFADWVMETAPSFLTSETMEDVVIRTTLDTSLQKKAEEGLAWVFDNKLKEGSNAQAAIVVMSADGAVRAMVGGRKIEAAGSFNRATQALRQTGSSFKPFVYAAALDQGWSPMDFVEDTPLTIDIPGSGPWTPKNYDGEFKGLITLTQALAESRNIPAVRVSEAVGRENVRQIAADFGIASDMAAGPALALGASESTLIEMTGAYAGILNGGSSVSPYGIRILEVPGNEELNMFTETGIGERVISEEAAQQLVYMMAQVVNDGTGTRAQLDGRPAAGKTGTTTAGRDAWFIGFTADYVAGVWMGYDDNTPLKGVTGGGLPAEIWHEVMMRVHDGLPVTELPMLVPAPRQPPVPDPVPQTPEGFFQSLDEALGGLVNGGGQTKQERRQERKRQKQFRKDQR